MKIRDDHTVTTILRKTRRIIHCVLIMLAMGYTCSAMAKTVLVIYESDNPYQQRLLETLIKRGAQTQHPDVTLRPLPGNEVNQNVLDQSKADLILSLGYKNAQRMLRLSAPPPILHALIPQARLYSLYPCLPNCPNPHSLLMLDQPIERQLALIQQVAPHANRIGLFRGSLNQTYLDHLLSAGKRLGFEMFIEDTSPRLLGSHIDHLAQRVDLLLATADPVLYNPSTIPEILLTSYRHHVPVVGFSKGFVRAGAIAAVTSNLDQFSQQIDEILIRFYTQGTLPQGIIPPKYYRVFSNRNVARSLNLNFKEDATLLNRIKRSELAD